MDALARDRSGPKLPGRSEAAKTIRLVRPATRTLEESSRPRSLRLKPEPEGAAAGDDLAVARIAERFAPDPQSGAEGGVSLCPPAPEPSSWRDHAWDLRRLTAWIAIALLLGGLAAVSAVAIGAFELNAPSKPHAADKRHPPQVLSASAAGKPVPSEPRPRAKSEQVANQPALPNKTAKPPTASVDANDVSQPEPGQSLFSDVSMLRADGEEADIPFAAIYPAATNAVSADTPEPEPEAVPQADDEPSPEPNAATQDVVSEPADEKWIVLPNAINLRTSPAVSARVIGVMHKGSRLKEIGRKRGWVQVTDPETGATGWLYPAARPGAKTARGEAKQNAAEKQGESKGFLEVVGNWLSGK